MRYAKAIVGALIAGLTATGTALADSQITGPEWIAAVVAALVALGGVWAVPNAAPTARVMPLRPPAE